MWWLFVYQTLTIIVLEDTVDNKYTAIAINIDNFLELIIVEFSIN